MQIGTPVAVLVEEQDMVSAFASFTAADAGAAGAAPAAASTPPPPAPSAGPAAALAAPKPGKPAAAKPAAVMAPGSRVIASPYAKKLAADAGVSLQGVAGSGPAGRIVAADVQNFLASGQVGDLAHWYQSDMLELN